MVYIHLPNQLTDEEEMLQKKFAKLRKKKKAVLALRAPKPELKPEVVEPKKRPAEAAADATAQAKKLLKLGAIKLGVDKKDQHSFKRTKRQKDSGVEKAPIGFQPFSPVHTPECEPEKPSPEGISRPRIKSLKETFVTAGRRESDGVGRPEFRPYERRERRAPKKGKTIFVKGPGLTEEILRSAFGSLGNIVNVSMEKQNNGFVTFETMEAASDAIRQMHECKVGNVQLHVSMAFNQPSFDPPPPTISCTSGGVVEAWGSISESKSKRAPESEQSGEGRDLVSYDVDMFG